MGKTLLTLTLAGTLSVLATSCRETVRYVEHHPTAQGALIGTAAGAGLGAVVGEATEDKPAEGALIGGVAGAAVGAGVGYLIEQNRGHHYHYHHRY
ncbi:MAG: YMGG-like glycine zipper-containing protein [Candidatus Sumerlaeota bacterium]|nr:YMGG-like glycine zipper-containing protein [Candidatus Sumerlaeota bacterium]